MTAHQIQDLKRQRRFGDAPRGVSTLGEARVAVLLVSPDFLASAENGELVKRVVLAGFTHLLTADQNLEFRQNIHSSELSFIVLRGGTRIRRSWR